ncbi:uncharacterized protein LOC118647796 [Monomorium pharaonis]|uniref:uncharacterized protein LOC118647796 n=1 Tax=Monomorium pharaonis TaxID=307658 RepID=UPI001746E2C7|nr:uncharacterized protein LOC118647796 [Monomorium pharaonis]XP_036149229.1 uncharacterized protein LOC118647796 [Monomorium pharaonis]XP_036149230.1 uncharacterized protein LOC118647796 [Monomorium pharaonis]
MCTCNSNFNNNGNHEEYYSALSDIQRLSPDDWRTSTRHPEDLPQEHIATPTASVQRDYPRPIPRLRTASPRRPLIASGVAILPRRIDFDAAEEEYIDVVNETDAKETEQLRTPHHPRLEPIVTPRTYTLRRTRATQHPVTIRESFPRLIRHTPCGKCLRL